MFTENLPAELVNDLCNTFNVLQEKIDNGEYLIEDMPVDKTVYSVYFVITDMHDVKIAEIQKVFDVFFLHLHLNNTTTYKIQNKRTESELYCTLEKIVHARALEHSRTFRSHLIGNK